MLFAPFIALAIGAAWFVPMIDSARRSSHLLAGSARVAGWTRSVRWCCCPGWSSIHRTWPASSAWLAPCWRGSDRRWDLLAWLAVTGPRRRRVRAVDRSFRWPSWPGTPSTSPLERLPRRAGIGTRRSRRWPSRSSGSLLARPRAHPDATTSALRCSGCDTRRRPTRPSRSSGIPRLARSSSGSRHSASARMRRRRRGARGGSGPVLFAGRGPGVATAVVTAPCRTPAPGHGCGIAWRFRSVARRRPELDAGAIIARD